MHKTGKYTEEINIRTQLKSIDLHLNKAGSREKIKVHFKIDYR